MEYKIVYEDGKPTRVEFKPDFVDSGGTYNDPLGKGLIEVFGVPNRWHYSSSGYLSRYIDNELKEPIAHCPVWIADAQEYITKLMDKAVEQRRIASVLESIQ